jgi:DNA-binding NtrC family response regulator
MKKLFQAYDGTLFESEKAGIDYEFFSKQPVFVIVDDDPDILEILSTTLNTAKIKHKMFQDPLEAMNFISKNKVSRVFTDYHMKGYGLSGKWIKEICDQQNIECSIVSGDERIADISKIDFVQNCVSLIKSYTS